MSRGSKGKLTPETHKAIIDALSVGATHRMACEYAGISQETLYTWLDKGRAGAPRYTEFFEQFTRTQGRTAVGWLAKIEAAANAGDWRAVAWKLERRYPEDFGKQLVEHTGVIHHKLLFEILVKIQNPAELSDAELAGFIAEAHALVNGHS